MAGGAIVFDNIDFVVYILVTQFSIVFSRPTGRAVTTSRTFPIRVLNAPIARSNNAIVVGSPFRTISQVSDFVIVLCRKLCIVHESCHLFIV